MSEAPLLDIRNIAVVYRNRRGSFEVCSDVSLSVKRGEALAVIGESGSGKSVTVLAATGLLGTGGAVERGQVMFEGRDITALSPRQRRKAGFYGRRIGMIFQNPSRALDPVYTIGTQMNEALAQVGQFSPAELKARGAQWLRHVGLPDPEEALARYPHQLSGGQRQRVMIAIALASEPELLIADEPTTALDVTIQAQVLGLIRRLQKELNLALLIVTHDFGVVASIADRVAVMYAGQVVEIGSAQDIIRTPQHPYTKALMQSLPTGVPGDSITALPGSVPVAGAMPSGCRFHPRCPMADARCAAATGLALQPAPGAAGDRALRCLKVMETAE